MQEIIECDLRTPWAGPGIWSRVAVGGGVGGSLISGSLGEGPGLRRKPGHLSSSQGIRPLEELLIYRKLPVLGDLPSVGRFGSVCSSFVELGHIEERNL